MLAFSPLPVGQSFLGELCFRLDSVMHIVQAQMETEDPRDEGLDAFGLVSLLASILTRYEAREKALKRQTLRDAHNPAAQTVSNSSMGSVSSSELPFSPHTKSLPDDEFRSVMTRRKSMQIMQQQHRPTLEYQHGLRREKESEDELLSPVGSGMDTSLSESPILSPTTLNRLNWQHQMTKVHQFVTSDPNATSCLKVESFSQREHLEYCLYSIFVSIVSSIHHSTSASKQHRCRFQDFRTFVLNILLSNGRGDRGDAVPLGSTGRGACALQVMQTRECKSLYHCDKLCLARVDERDRHGQMKTRSYVIGTVKGGVDKNTLIRMVNIQTSRVDAELNISADDGHVAALTAAICSSPKGPLRLLFVSTANGMLRGYEVASGLKRQKIDCVFKTPLCQLGYLGDDRLFAGDTSGSFRIWKLDEVGRGIYLPDACLKSMEVATLLHIPRYHNGTITAFTVDQSKQWLFTAGTDCLIHLFCLRTLHRIKTFRGHRQMILGMTYNPKENVLVSAGTEFSVYCWPLEMVDSVPHVLAAPTGRGVISITSLTDSSLAVTMDPRGVLTVWDLRLLHWKGFTSCEPDADTETSKTVWSSFLYDDEINEILVFANRNMYHLAYDRFQNAHNPLRAHDGPIASGVFFDCASSTLVSCGGKALHVWDVELAKCRHSIANVANAVICSMTLIHSEGVLLLGLDDGHVYYYLTTTFRKFAEYTPSVVEPVVELIDLSGFDGCVAACRTENGHVDVMYLDTATNDCSGFPIRRGGGHAVESSTSASVNDAAAKSGLRATCLGHLRSQRVLLAGTKGNAVAVWSLVRKRQQDDYFFFENDTPPALTEEDFESGSVMPNDLFTAASFPVTEETTSVVGVDPGNMFAAGDSSGRIHLWAFSGKVAWALAHFPCRHYSSLLRSSRVTALHAIPELGLLYCGDDAGGVSAFDLTTCMRPSTSPLDDNTSTVRSPPSAAKRMSLLPSSETPLIAFDATRSLAQSAAPSSPTRRSNVTYLPPYGTPALSSAEIKPIVSWDAHPESCVQQIHSISRPFVLITVTTDSLMQMWYLGGSPIGFFVSPEQTNRLTVGEKQKGIDLHHQDDDHDDDDDDDDDKASLAETPSHSSLPSPTPQEAKRPRSQLVSFLTDFSFGTPVAQEEASHCDSVLERDHLETSMKKTSMKTTPSKTATKDTTAQWHRYNDLPAPYGNKSIAARKQTMHMLKGLMRFADHDLASHAMKTPNNDTEEDTSRLLRRLSMIPLKGTVNDGDGNQQTVPPFDDNSQSPQISDHHGAPQPSSSLFAASSAAKKLKNRQILLSGHPHLSLPTSSPSPSPLPQQSPPLSPHSRSPQPVLSKNPSNKTTSAHTNVLAKSPSTHNATSATITDDPIHGSNDSFQKYLKHALIIAQESTKQITAHYPQRTGGLASHQLNEASRVHRVGGGSPPPRLASLMQTGQLPMQQHLEDGIQSRHLPDTAFPSHQRKLMRATGALHHDERFDGESEEEVSQPAKDIRSLKSLRLSEAYQGNRDPMQTHRHATTNLQREARHLSVTTAMSSPPLTFRSPSRILSGLEAELVLKTMGEETTLQYHTELYKPVELPALRKAPPARSMFAAIKKTPVSSTAVKRRGDEDQSVPIPLGVITMITHSDVHARAM